MYWFVLPDINSMMVSLLFNPRITIYNTCIIVYNNTYGYGLLLKLLYMCNYALLLLVIIIIMCVLCRAFINGSVASLLCIKAADSSPMMQFFWSLLIIALTAIIWKLIKKCLKVKLTHFREWHNNLRQYLDNYYLRNFIKISVK